MKRRTILTIACVLTLVSALAISLWRSGKPEPSIPSQLRQANNVTPKSSATPSNHSLTPVPAIPTDAEIKRRNDQQIVAAYLTRISVYGKVVDENGNPIAAVAVKIGVADKPLQTGSSYTEMTDENGEFSLDGVRGIAFSLVASKSGYYTTNEAKGHRNVLVPGKDDIPQSTKTQPAVLVLHKQGQTVPLLTAKSRQIEVPRAGQPIKVDLVTGRAGQGDLQVASWIGGSQERRFDWRYQLTIPGGGLVERTGEFNFQAPNDGYQDTAQIDMAANAERWSSDFLKSYFAKLPDGRYARFSINFYPGQRRNFVVIESYVNPTPGDRNLEYDAAKAVHVTN